MQGFRSLGGVVSVYQAGVSTRGMFLIVQVLFSVQLFSINA